MRRWGTRLKTDVDLRGGHGSRARFAGSASAAKPRCPGRVFEDFFEISASMTYQIDGRRYIAAASKSDFHSIALVATSNNNRTNEAI